MSSLNLFRVAVQTALQNGLGITMYGGIRDGRVEDRDEGYVWVEHVVEDASNVNIELITLGVRVFKEWKPQQGQFRDVTAIEDLMELIQTTLKPLQTTLGPWFFRLTDLTPDYDNQHVTGTLLAYETNQFGQGG